MPSLSAVRASNQAWKPAFRPVVVVAGGTSGIGAGIATAFAKYAPKDSNAPYIIIIGRSRQGADSVIEEMKKVNAAGKYEFVQGDLTMMKNVRSVATEVSGKVDKINYLCMSPGVLTLKGQDDTDEGIDRKMALHFYSRDTFLVLFLLANLLIPKIRTAVDKGEDGRVLTVLAAGKGGAIDLEDLGLKKNASIKRKADSATTYNDLIVEELALRNPSISFTHAYPGWVNTNLIRNFPFYLRLPYLPVEIDFNPRLMLLYPFLVSASDCGEYMIYNLLRPEHRTGAHFVSDKGDEANKSRYHGDEAVRKKVWEHAVEVTGLSQ